MPMTSSKLLRSVLFVCTGNSCRSQLAEACLRHHAPSLLVRSAGVEPAPAVASATLRTLRARGYPAEGLQTKSLAQTDTLSFDLVITLSHSAAVAVHSMIPKDNHLHHEFHDPYHAHGSEQEIDAVYDRVLSEIEEWLASHPEVGPHMSPRRTA